MAGESSEVVGFYAYPSTPEHVGETIEYAIKDINKRKVCRINSWRRMNVSGKIVINEILNRIDEADIVACDLTGLNANVLFEFGYAVARKKRVWVTVDKTNPENVKQVKALPVLSQIGFVAHENNDDIVAGFFSENPYLDLAKHVLVEYEGIIEGYSKSLPNNDVFYLPSPVASTASKQLTRFLQELRRKTIIDDHLENSYEPLSWYLTNILNSRFIIVHLQNEEREDHLQHNALYGFLAGIARGFSRGLLMLVPMPFEAPFDYRGLLQVHKNAEHCVRCTREWLIPELAKGKAQTTSTQAGSPDRQLTLLRFHIGESTAENEENELGNYFLPTGAFKFGVESKLCLFIGRKGTGKTANLYRIRDYFSAESMNLVITVKPVSFRLETFAYLINDVFTRHDMAVDFIERVWRVVVYTEIAAALHERLVSRPSYYDLSTVEEEFLRYCKDNERLLESDFGDKIELIHELTKETIAAGNAAKEVLGLISKKFVEPLLKIFAVVFKKYQQIIILVDNLDKAWQVQKEVDVQASIVFGLLGFQNTIRRDLAWSEGDVRLLVFLREDIYRYVLGHAREPDKIQLSTFRISWDNPALLLKLIEERFLICDSSLLRPDIWAQLFCPTIQGRSTTEFLSENVLPRPRDLIHVVKNAIAFCINRNGERIEESDIVQAHRLYFQFLLDNLVTEYGRYFADIRNLILSFMEAESPLSTWTLRRIVKDFNYDRKEHRALIEILIDISFLGVKIGDKVKFSYSGEDTEQIVRHFDKSRGLFGDFKPELHIHKAFFTGLQINSK